ncbi:general amino acid permease [Fusarium agapanthi]|uniref:General amino acid permease n=1 Tax=Fusarium agapanthi TaxID=1803897 RepID=A0A9P5BFX2_9HYPO|nr:general amino acid permease [Fusarium agapanthi]
MKLINIIPIHLFLHCTHATFLPKDDVPDGPGVVYSKPPDGGIKWTRCNLGIPEYKKYEKNKALECGTLKVPLDYTDKYTNTTILNLIKLKADEKSTEKAPRGSIIVNFGGPGASGVEGLLLLQALVDVDIVRSLQYDIISFDPRGTGKTMVPPVDEGILTEMSEELVYTVQNSAYFLTQDLLSDALDYISTFAEFFVTRDEEYREFRGTAFVARDIAAIATALGEGDRINYWGISYGTVLGQVLAGMFPDRIERMLLDSNLLADDYVKNLGLDSIMDAEKALYHFYDECMAATNNTCHSANKLPEDRDDFLEVLDRVFMVCTGVGGGLGRPKSLSLTLWFLTSLYGPLPGYLWLDELIDTALEGNRSMCPQQIYPVANMTAPWNPQSDLAHLAIMCSDATFRIETIEEGISLYKDERANKDPFFLPMLASRVACSRWNTHAAQPIDLGSLSRVKTKNPILLVNGKYDPVTPLDHARKISARFPGSQVVVHEGVGHSIFAHSSSCILAKVVEYFISGKVPLEEITCKPDQTAFELVDAKRKEMEGLAGKVFLLTELVNRRLLSAKTTINPYQISSSPTRSGGVRMSADILATGGKASPSMGVETRNDNNGDLVTATEEQSLQRGLHERHLSMLGIAGAIGTGLFLGLGQSVQTGGPLGALLGYATVGLVVCAVQFALGEVAALLPVTGAFVRHAEFLVDPAWGFAIGWNLVYGNILSIPSEITAICVLFEFWTDINPSLWIIIFIVLTTVVGLCFVRVFGEVEFWFALLKILLVVFLIIMGLVINLGGVPGTERIGFRYWKDPGPFVEYIASGSWGQFLGYWSVMTSAVFSFAGVESIAMAAAETRNPARAIPKACKNVFIRILVFYILAILIVGMLVRSDDERLNDQSGAAGQSPFVIAASAAGIPAIPSVVNAVVITSAWSASNQSLLAGTRVLYGLALKRQAPQIFLRTTAWGVPYVCVLFFTCFMFLSFMSLSNGAMTVFWWLVDLTAAGVLISWASILLNHIRLRLAMKKQGIPIKKLPWHNSWTFYSSYAGLFMTLLILLTGGFRVFTRGNWDPVGFVSSYLDIPLVIGAYLIWKFVKKTKVVPLAEIPLQDAFRKSEEDHEVVNA